MHCVLHSHSIEWSLRCQMRTSHFRHFGYMGHPDFFFREFGRPCWQVQLQPAPFPLSARSLESHVHVWASCVRQSCVWASCVWWQSCVVVCEQVVCDKVVCDDCMWQSCVWKMVWQCGVRQSCVWASCVWVAKLCGCVWTSCLWQSCVWRLYVTKLCVKDGVTVWCATKLCVSKLCVSGKVVWLCVSKLCVTIVCSKLCVKERGGGGRGAGYRIKNKNPTQRCGEHISILLILILRFNFWKEKK